MNIIVSKNVFNKYKMINMLKRKVDLILENWKNNEDRYPLIIKGARQIGKTTSIRQFAKKNYESLVELNFIRNPEYIQAFENTSNPKDIIMALSLVNPNFNFIPGKTLLFIDEIQKYPNAATSLKFFYEQHEYDVICSGSLLGAKYKKVSSISVGYKTDYTMYSLDFEEFLWAKGYTEDQIEYIYKFMKELKPLPEFLFNTLNGLFKQYIYCGGMPAIVDRFITQENFSGIFEMQEQIHLNYEEDITNYVEGLNTARVLNVYRHITSQLAKENHKYQITKLGHGARFRDYRGCEEWLKDAGIVNLAYNVMDLTLPLKGNEIDNNLRMYYGDTSFLVAAIDDESKKDFVQNANFDIYSGALFENLVAESLVKQGYKDLFFYKNEDSTIELDFLIRVKNEIVPIEVKAKRGKAVSLNKILENKILNFGIKLSMNNIGFEKNIFTFPYFLTFLLKRFFKENEIIQW